MSALGAILDTVTEYVVVVLDEAGDYSARGTFNGSAAACAWAEQHEAQGGDACFVLPVRSP